MDIITRRDRVVNRRFFTADCFLVPPGFNGREAAAWHEAAHAVVGTLFDFDVRYASIIPEDGFVGHCELGSPTPGRGVPLPGIPRIICYLGYSLAGCAVELIRQTMPEDTIPASDADSVKPLVVALAEHIGKDPNDCFQEFLAHTVELVSEERVWSAIEQVAAVLLDCDVTQGAQVRRIVRDCGLDVVPAEDQIRLALALAERQ